MKVRMLVSIAGAHVNASPGDMWECTKAEAARLIEAGYAEPARKQRTPVEVD